MAAEGDPAVMREPAIVASVLGAGYASLRDEAAELEAAGVDLIQWDVMDGRFVPNLTFGADVVAACRPLVDLPFEAHLMENPERWAEPFLAAGCDTLIVHQESCPTSTGPSCRSETSAVGPA